MLLVCFVVGLRLCLLACLYVCLLPPSVCFAAYAIVCSLEQQNNRTQNQPCWPSCLPKFLHRPSLLLAFVAELTCVECIQQACAKTPAFERLHFRTPRHMIEQRSGDIRAKCCFLAACFCICVFVARQAVGMSPFCQARLLAQALRKICGVVAVVSPNVL